MQSCGSGEVMFEKWMLMQKPCLIRVIITFLQSSRMGRTEAEARTRCSDDKFNLCTVLIRERCMNHEAGLKQLAATSDSSNLHSSIREQGKHVTERRSFLLAGALRRWVPPTPWVQR